MWTWRIFFKNNRYCDNSYGNCRPSVVDQCSSALLNFSAQLFSYRPPLPVGLLHRSLCALKFPYLYRHWREFIGLCNQCDRKEKEKANTNLKSLKGQKGLDLIGASNISYSDSFLWSWICFFVPGALSLLKCYFHVLLYEKKRKEISETVCYIYLFRYFHLVFLCRKIIEP